MPSTGRYRAASSSGPPVNAGLAHRPAGASGRQLMKHGHHNRALRHHRLKAGTRWSTSTTGELRSAVARWRKDPPCPLARLTGRQSIPDLAQFITEDLRGRGQQVGPRRDHRGRKTRRRHRRIRHPDNQLVPAGCHRTRHQGVTTTMTSTDGVGPLPAPVLWCPTVLVRLMRQP